MKNNYTHHEETLSRACSIGKATFSSREGGEKVFGHSGNRMNSFHFGSGNVREKFLLFLLFFIISINFSSAGLVVSGNFSNLTKTDSVNQIVSLTISNTESFNFFNIKLEDESTAKIDKIAELDAGQNMTVPMTILGNSNFKGQIKLIGYYQTNVGQSNKTILVRIDHSLDEGVDKCNVDLIKGDMITWINTISGEVKLINTDSNTQFQTILQGNNYTNKFTDAQILHYQVTRLGLPYSSICTINVAGDNGLVHGSAYDGYINMSLKISYPPTTLVATFLSSNYNTTYNGEIDDIFSIRNTGTNIAKNITLSGDWISFSVNNFDLGVGQTRNIGIAIKPFITSTDQTNKTQVKNISIIGNFPELDQSFNIFIYYQDMGIAMSNNSYDPDLLRKLIKYGCTQNPNWEECNRGTLNGGNNTQKIVSTTFTEETVKGLIDHQIQADDSQAVKDKEDTDFKQNVTQALNNQNSVQQNQTEKMNELSKKIEEGNFFAIFMSVFFTLLACLGVLAFYLLKIRTRMKLEKKSGLQKSEVLT
jgi:hypothetical protein